MSPDFPTELRTIDWLAPWGPANADLSVELGREVGPGHPLFGRRAVAVGRRHDQDDVLFWLPDGPALLAVVHLTWTGQRERSPTWPFTTLFASLDEWIERAMRSDHAEHSRSL
jgi:hypothetical protein